MKHLILFTVLLTGSALAQFQNHTKEMGIENAPAGRAQVIDVNGDGWLDLCVGGENPNAPGAYRIYFNKPNPNGGRVFEDATEYTRINLQPNGKPGRWNSFLIWGDFDNDGDVDAVSIATQTTEQYQKDPQTYTVYLNDGKGQFKASRRCGLERKEFSQTIGAVVTDFDLDGKLDVAFANNYIDANKGLEAQPMRVYKGDGKGHFKEVTQEWGMLSDAPPGAATAERPLYGLTACDLNNDGYSELIGAAYGRQWNTCWTRTKDKAIYYDIAAMVGIDGDQIRHGRYTDAVKKMFADRKMEREDELPFRSNGNTFSIAPCDFDGDGDLDLFSAEITHWWAGESSDLSALLINQFDKIKEPFFVRALEELKAPDPQTGLKWRPTLGLARDHSPQPVNSWNQGDLQAHWSDLNNDGLVDLILCESDYPNNHLRVWLQKPDRTFVESESALGLIFNCCPGIALGDTDRDGDLDIAATGTRTRWAEARPKSELAFFENQIIARMNSGSAGRQSLINQAGDQVRQSDSSDLFPNQDPEFIRGNKTLSVKLIGDGKTCNRNAIGARVILTTTQGTQTRDVMGAYGHWAQQTQPGEVHFGLGNSVSQSIKIIWADAKRSETIIKDLKRDSWIIVHQSSGKIEILETFDAKRWSMIK